MNRLTKQQIAFVKERITSGGVTTPELIEDLLDHLCTSIETEIDNGLSFEAALGKTFNQLSEDELKLTEMKTQEALEGKEIYYPNLSQSFGLVGLTWLLSIFIMFISVFIIEGMGFSPAFGQAFVTLLSLFIICGSIAIAVKWIRQSQPDGPIFSFRKVSTYVYLVLFIISLLMSFWVDPLRPLTLMSWQSLKMYIDSLSNSGISPLLFSFSFTFIIELLIRGVILNGLLKTLTPGWAIFWSSVFAVTFNYINPLRTLVINLLMGWVYWKTKSLNATLFMISTWLAASMLPNYLLGNRDEFFFSFNWRALFSNFNLYVTLVVLALLLTFGLFYFLHKKLSSPVKA